MKKNLFFVAFVLLFSSEIFSQARIGIMLSPSLSFNRVSSKESTFNISPDGSGGRFIFGPTIDLPIGENKYFTSGLFFATKRVGLKVTDPVQVKETYNLQYLQIPATLKLFTNELAIDTRAYFNIGITADIKIFEKDLEKDQILVDKFVPLDLGALVGAGVERKVGSETALFIGFSYHRGLMNVVSEKNSYDNFTLKNDMLSLDLGIIF